ncbi:RNA/RNP complex-1-interacting phosphatase-like [Dermacentor albipictus]|uniref:RNA/RNP complex-1-interacting phosphatase-like n=1 Tax=Dermacentor albipictus TaxID=60249 RepID=UPI0038FCB0AA
MAPSRNAIPNRWLDYADHGSNVPGTRFITFKVPLREAVCSSLPINFLSLWIQGLGIDLTNTDRYYDHNCVVSRGVAHIKIRCPRACVPNERVVKSFFAAVGEFVAKPDNDDKLVGVHCTHGVNRTGYVVCRYMVDKLGIAPATAIEGFQKARGHNFDRQEYVSNLRARSLQSPK